MRCLVTGGAGFIGSNLAKKLESLGHTVTILDNFDTGCHSNLVGFTGRVIRADTSKHKWDEEYDAIFHQAAITDPRYPDGNKLFYKNVHGFSRILNLAEHCDCPLIYASSAAIYGNGPSPQKERQRVDIQSAYAESKLTMDELAMEKRATSHIVGLRYFNVYGDGESNKSRAASMIFHLSSQMKKGESPRIFTDGEQSRDFIHVDDVISANLAALDAPSGIYNVGTGIGTTFNELVRILNKVLGTNLPPSYFEMPYEPKSYQRDTRADITRAEVILGFKAKISLEEGIASYV